MRSRELAVSVLLLLSSLAGAQNSVDHPVVGAFGGSRLIHQEISRFGEYEIAVGAGETQSVLGEVWMTLYNAPEDSSTFSVYSTYLSFLETEGFEILVSTGPGDTPPDLLEQAYFRAPFADDGNLGHLAPFTNGSDAQSAFISARRDDGIHVSLAIAAGWEAYPQYKLDVVQVGENSQLIGAGGAGLGATEDHPVIGRYNRSAVVHQEVSTFGEYQITAGDGSVERIQGEIWMTLYDAPSDGSTFSVYATYLDFLQAEGFDIVESCKPGDCPGRLLAEVYGRAPFADNGNFGHPAPFTNGSDLHAAYIAARRAESIYVSIAIAAGWEAYPQYKLDVVDLKADGGSISSSGSGSEPSPESVDGSGRSAVADSVQPLDGLRQSVGLPGGFFSGNGALEIRGGIAGYLLLDPAIAGGLVVTDTGAAPAVEADGFKNLYGPYVRAAYFPNESVGIGFEAAFMESDEQFTVDDTTYRSQAELQSFQAAVLVRFVGSEYPATVTMAITGGAAVIELQQSTESLASTYQSVEDILGVFGSSVDMAIPVVRFAHLTAGMSYLFVPFTTLTLANNDSSSTRTYHEGNLGGLQLRLGIVLEL